MKRIPLPLIFFCLLFGSSLLTGLNNYRTAKERIVTDMNQALAKALEQQEEAWLTPDTIHNYRQHLQIDALREESYIYYATVARTPALRSRSMTWQGGGKRVAYQSYANLSMASIVQLTDLRLPSLLLLSAFGCAFFSLLKRRPMAVAPEMLPASSVPITCNFSSASLAIVHLTPMQRELMEMFFQAEGHHLSKQEICARLWPKKDNPNETLYTLIRRLKPVVEEQLHLKIVAQRGGGYTLRPQD